MSKASGLISVTGFQPITALRIGPYVKGVLELQRFDFAQTASQSGHLRNRHAISKHAEVPAAAVETASQKKRKSVGRPRPREDGGRRESTNQRESYTNELKLNVAKRLRSSGDPQIVIKEFWPNLHPSAYNSRRKVIGKWKNKIEKLENACSTTRGKLRTRERSKGTGTILGKDAEGDIVSWVDDLTKEGVPISTLMLSLKADEVATSYNVDNFHASWCWQQHFKS